MTDPRVAVGNSGERLEMFWSKSSHVDWRSWGLAVVVAVNHGWWLSWVVGPWHGHVEPLL